MIPSCFCKKTGQKSNAMKDAWYYSY